YSIKNIEGRRSDKFGSMLFNFGVAEQPKHHVNSAQDWNDASCSEYVVVVVVRLLPQKSFGFQSHNSDPANLQSRLPELLVDPEVAQPSGKVGSRGGLGDLHVEPRLEIDQSRTERFLVGQFH